MELAGQWRREWAGTAEFGKVTEGGVTRRVARAMEVLHASGPGAKVRVMRAAYHSSSGPGIPASSYMLHSSRRVISSGFNLLESPTYPTKPLEISSTPLEASPEYNTHTENYKVTEPDDTEISEPSKWRGTSSGNSIRMPSEESSSTDNASIIELDSRLSHKGVHRKYSYDSENSDYSVQRSSTRASPLLDAPVTLSTLKYKSLLNGSNDWNNRRKSYSFEDTSPLNEVILQSNDTLAMESSTDSGICKSTEIVNDYPEDTTRSYDRKHNKYESTFDQWHAKNIPNTFYKGSKYKSYKEHDIVVEDPLENTIALQSKGKISITVPITLEDHNHFKNSQTIDDSDRKIKKVEFCKTELHFAAESGKVNIIATDEKPPPTSDFRKRRSAFVPINDRFEKPITLFGEKTDFLEGNKSAEYGSRGFSDSIEYDENTAATRSILKNKIPKPKPYLLGENMAFGDFKKSLDINSAPNGVSLINKQLETKRDDNTEEQYNITGINDRTFRNSLRASNKSLFKYESSAPEKDIPDKMKTSPERKNNDSIRNKFNEFNMSPVHKAKTRQLRESDLTYFGIGNNHKNINSHNNDISSISIVNTKSGSIQSQSHFVDEDFRSVRLVKRISNSAQNSETESEDSPEYQNLPLKTNFAPIPTPRSRVKYKKPDEGVVILKPIVEQVNDISIVVPEPRRSRHRRQEENVSSVRSLSEPAKKRIDYTIQRYGDLRSSTKRDNTIQRYKERKENEQSKKSPPSKPQKYRHTNTDAEDEVPLYVNINKPDSASDCYQESHKTIGSVRRNSERVRTNKSDSDSGTKRQNSVKKNIRVQRTEKLSTPEYPIHPRNRETIITNKLCKETNITVTETSPKSAKQRNKSSHRLNKENEIIALKASNDEKDLTLLKIKTENKNSVNEAVGNTSTSSINKRKELRKNREPSVEEHGIISKEIKSNDKTGEKNHPGTNDRKATRRSEYVIKYDDKNGTVSSVSKVRGGHSASRQRHVSKERNKGQHTKESKRNDKITEKSGLRNAAP